MADTTLREVTSSSLFDGLSFIGSRFNINNNKGTVLNIDRPDHGRIFVEFLRWSHTQINIINYAEGLTKVAVETL